MKILTVILFLFVVVLTFCVVELKISNVALESDFTREHNIVLQCGKDCENMLHKYDSVNTLNDSIVRANVVLRINNLVYEKQSDVHVRNANTVNIGN